MTAPALAFGTVVRRSRRTLPLLGASALAGTLSLLALPLALANAIDSAVAGRGAQTWTWIAAALILLGVACDLVDAFTETTCTADAAAWLRRGLVRRMLGIPHRIREFDTGDLVARTSAGAADAAQAGPGVIGGLAAALPPVGALGMLLWLDWTLALAFAIGLALVAMVLRLFAKETAAAAMAYQRAQGTMAARLTEAIGGRRTIAAAGTVDTETERVLSDLPELAEHGKASWRALSAAGARAAVAGPLATVGVLAVAGILVGHGRMSAGEVLAAGQYAMLGAGLGSLTGVLGVLARAKAAVARLGEVHAVPVLEYGDRTLPQGTRTNGEQPAREGEDTGSAGAARTDRSAKAASVPSQGLPAGPGAPHSTHGLLELRAVTVEGPTGPLLEDVTFTVPGGAVAAVVGASGSGKSVLAAVASRLRDPDRGEVRLDGVPLHHLSSEALRDAVGTASERPALAGATLADAMGPGRPREAVTAAAAAVGADGFAERLPDRYDTPLDQVPMSGGEAQRIGLARAWRAERLLVLDDATAALDAVSELRIAEALAASGRTRLVVTHQVRVAAQADMVVWLEAGAVRAAGPHRTLWADPDYREVFYQ
ncbi:ATP-binding cassette domain-containing protein [Glycomyces tritici]|uniref:ABC transporter ATP-binding protein n=1 Tax=Glycomyces tritici TaxID=2665176 RepID=A0ABT7YVT4_9ACTN|nr:ABC transporter ATP-binding protein [Glycomyces tritici]MDN3242755.1 ABC transporter ATP-binding protein [Glycomyces tritici]